MGKNSRQNFLKIADLIKGSSIFRFYAMIDEMQNYSNDQIIAWQIEKLVKLLNYYYNNSKYYKNIFEEINLLPNDIKSIQDLRFIPKITKSDFRKNYDDLLPIKKNSRKYITASTGGSTGETLKYNLDYDTWSYITANRLYYWNKVGYNLGDLHIALGSSSLFPIEKFSLYHSIFYRLKGKIPLNGINMSDEIIEKYIHFIMKKKIEFIYGYASSIYLIAKYIDKKRIKLKFMKAVISTSEMLTDHYRETIERNFNCQILDAYGAADGGITAYKLNKYFEVSYNSIVLLEDENKKESKLLVTDLFNYTFPFINYEVGDVGSLLKNDNSSSNSYNGQLIAKIEGRSSEIMEFENGRKITGPGFTILFKDLNVLAYRLVKTGPNSLKVFIVQAAGYNRADENKIETAFKKQLGSDVNLFIEYVNRIEVSPSGKNKYFYSN